MDGLPGNATLFLRWLNDQDGLAGWAQAIGATTAILLTWFLARSEVRMARAQEVEQMKVALFLIADAHDHLARFSRSFENREGASRIAKRLESNSALRHARDGMIRAEERGGLPAAALSALISASADISRALEFVREIPDGNPDGAIASYRGAVATLKNRCKSLASVIAARGGTESPGDPAVLARWLEVPLHRRLRSWVYSRTTGRLMMWSMSSNSRAARWYRRYVLRARVMYSSNSYDQTSAEDRQPE